NFPTIYGSAKQGWYNTSLTPTGNINAVLDAILEHVPEPVVSAGKLQMQITSLDYSSFLGRIAIGRVGRGTIKEGQNIQVCKTDGSFVRGKIKELYTFEGMGKKKVQEVHAGDICAVV